MFQQSNTNSVSSGLAVQPKRSLESFGVWALLAALVLAIVVFIPSSSSLSSVVVKTFLLAATGLVALALYILARLSRGNIILPPMLLVGALWLPAGAYLLSASFSGVSFNSALWGSSLGTDTLGFMLMAACIGTLASLMIRRTDQYRQMLTVGALAFGIVVLMQAAMLVISQFSSIIAPDMSVLGSYQNLAFFLGLGLICSLISIRFLDMTRRAFRLLLACGIAALVLLAAANVSLVWILLGLAALGMFVEAVMHRAPSASDDDDMDDTLDFAAENNTDTGHANRSLVLSLAVLAISLFFVVGGAIGGAFANAMHLNLLSISPSWQSTIATARNVYATSPVFGTGPGTFGADWLKYRDASLNANVFWNVDFSSGVGVVPTSFATVGLVGVFAWIAFFALFAIFGLRMLLWRAPQDQFARYTAILAFVAFIYLFAVAVFSLPNVALLVLAFFFAGIMASCMRFAVQGQQWGIVFARSPRLGFVVVFSLTLLLLASVVAAYALAVRGISTVELARANDSYAKGDLSGADNLVRSAISFSPSAIAYQMKAGIAGARVNEIIASSTMSQTAAQSAFQTALSDGINAALTATSLAPYDYQSWLALGNLYAQAVPVGISGSFENAKTAYNKAAELNPTNPQIPFVIARLHLANKDVASAEESLKSAVSLKQDYTQAIFLLSQLEVQEGKVKEALDSALAAAYFTPNNPDILFQVGILYAAQNELNNAALALSAAVDANPQFANARYFLAAVYAKQSKYDEALAQIQAIADLSSDNATAVASQIETLRAGKNPFPANLLSLEPAAVGK